MVNEYFENFFSTIKISKSNKDNTALLSAYKYQVANNGETLREKVLFNIKQTNPYLYEVFLTELEYVGTSDKVFYWVSMYYGARSMASITENYKIPYVRPEIINTFYEEEIVNLDSPTKITVDKINKNFRNNRMKEMFYAMYRDRKNSNVLDGFWSIIITKEQGMITPWIRPFFNLVLLIHRQQKFDTNI